MAYQIARNMQKLTLQKRISWGIAEHAIGKTEAAVWVFRKA